MSATTRAAEALPPSLAPRGLNRVMGAAYVGVSPGLFDLMVGDGRMPKPKDIGRRKVWDRHEIDQAFDALDADDIQQADREWEGIDA